MTTKPRSSGGCWTCRLRRKKCDEERPACQGCLALEIDCLYSDDKPDWMDGGERQKQKAEWLKAEVKRRATHRRERRYLQGLEVRLESLDASLTDDSDTTPPKVLINAVPASASASSQASPPESILMHTDSTPNQTDSSVSASSPEEHHAGGPAWPGFSLRPAWPQDPVPQEPVFQEVLTQELEAQSVMVYLDYVFPFLFPYYRPSFADVGRGWLLVLLMKNKALFHSALSLAGYFYSIVLGHVPDAAQECQVKSLEGLHEQQGLALQWLQREMQDIITRGVKGNLAEANRVMASIIQLLTCDVAIANPGNWPMHLDAATELFNEIMERHAATDAGHYCFMMVLLQLGSRPFEWTPRTRPWGSDQAILRFFTAQLLFFDTLASTALQQPPRLQRWHQHLMMTQEEEATVHIPASLNLKEQTMPHMNLQEFVGLDNWVVLAIADIAALDAWKKEMKRAGSLSFTQLMCRAAAIDQRLQTSLQALEESEAKHNGASSLDEPQHLLQYFGGKFSHRMMHSSALNTRIWAQASITYLSVVLSGWQPSSAEVRASVTRTIDMLLALPSPDCLRTLAWPFTVTGCLAARDQEHVFTEMVGRMGPLRVFGTIREGLAIMQKVWERRAEIEANPDQWDLAACLRCLGQPALLL